MKKFTWSQGRWLWVLGSIYALEENGPFRAVSKEDLRTGMDGTWDFITKHSIYGGSICCYVLTRDGEKKPDLEYYEKSFTYAFTVFPNYETGEWIQIHKRDSAPEDKVVALPVKAPFHIMRNFVKIVELLMESE